MALDLADAQREVAQSAPALPIAELRPGTLRWDRTAKKWAVTVGTNAVPAVWSEHITPKDGAPCVVGMMTEPTGQTTAWVLAMTAAKPADGATGKATVVPAGSATITVDVGGNSQTATIVSPYGPTVGDDVLLEQRGGVLYAVGRVGLPAVNPYAANTGAATAVPPPPPPVTGTSDFRSQDSGTWTQGYNWNGHYGQNTYAGSGYVPPSSGSWFYHGQTTSLGDKTNITAVRFYLGPRRQAGNYNQAATVHFYRHDHNSKGGSEPGRTHGPHDISIPPGWGGGWVTLPQSFGVALKGGGGISIAGDPYVGFTSGSESPASGTLSIDWSK